MSDREGLMAAIAADPADDVPRLVLADWLEERGDPLGEFIRLQMALEPLRVPRADPAAELERNKRLRGISPGADFPDDSWPVKWQHDREWALLCEHRAEWLGEAAPLEEVSDWRFQPEFRRGFVASAGVAVTALLDHGHAIRRGCPALQELALFGSLGMGQELAACRWLAGLPALMAGWLDTADAEALARSPHLAGLRSLTAWIGLGEDDVGVCSALARLPRLRTLRLVHMRERLPPTDQEMEATEETGDAPFLMSEQAAAAVRGLRPELAVVLERPSERWLPLDGAHVGLGLLAGHNTSGRAVLAGGVRDVAVHSFGEDGRHLRSVFLGTSAPPGDDPVMRLATLFRIRPGPIFVRELQPQGDTLRVSAFADQPRDIRADLDSEGAEEADDDLYSWWTTGRFLISYNGSEHIMDAIGRVDTPGA